ncbi:hypothetical protein G4B88_031492 [Cannabis sativa]|uniref:Uncharacterized protein n=1 Tax=Cannabis sativa TaxID=3483 RepID=A0A7J6G4E7_CANSA|nr:hypothetical protein G4B88_031492 [Cannabis sativa]
MREEKPTPAQRERILNKQLHNLIEQLVSKQAQAKGLVRSGSEKGFASSDYIVEPNYKNLYSSGGQNESQQRLIIEPQASFAGKGNRTLTLLEKKLTPGCHQPEKEMSEDGRRRRRWR